MLEEKPSESGSRGPSPDLMFQFDEEQHFPDASSTTANKRLTAYGPLTYSKGSKPSSYAQITICVPSLLDITFKGTAHSVGIELGSLFSCQLMSQIRLKLIKSVKSGNGKAAYYESDNFSDGDRLLYRVNPSTSPSGFPMFPKKGTDWLLKQIDRALSEALFEANAAVKESVQDHVLVRAFNLFKGMVSDAAEKMENCVFQVRDPAQCQDVIYDSFNSYIGSNSGGFDWPALQKQLESIPAFLSEAPSRGRTVSAPEITTRPKRDKKLGRNPNDDLLKRTFSAPPEFGEWWHNQIKNTVYAAQLFRGFSVSRSSNPAGLRKIPEAQVSQKSEEDEPEFDSDYSFELLTLSGKDPEECGDSEGGSIDVIAGGGFYTDRLKVGSMSQQAIGDQEETQRPLFLIAADAIDMPKRRGSYSPPHDGNNIAGGPTSRSNSRSILEACSPWSGRNHRETLAFMHFSNTAGRQAKTEEVTLLSSS